MDTLELVGSVIGFLIYAYLLYEQNTIMKEQNRIMREQAGETVTSQAPSRAKLYWPMLVMGLLTLASWTAVVVFQKIHTPYPFAWTGEHYDYINGKTFANEEVILDGKSYKHCTFQHVTFKFNGTAPFQFSYNQIVGAYGFKTDNLAVLATFAAVKGLGMQTQNMKIFGPDGSLIDVSPPTHDAPPTNGLPAATKE